MAVRIWDRLNQLNALCSFITAFPSTSDGVKKHIEVIRERIGDPQDERDVAVLRELADVEQKNVSPHRKSFLKKLRGYFTVDTAGG